MKIGKISESVLKRSVLRQIKAKQNEILNGAGVGADCAVFTLPGKEKGFTQLLSCMQEGVLKQSFALEHREAFQADLEPVMGISHLLQKCANNLAAGGSDPIAAMITILLPEETEEPYLKAVMAEAERTCEMLSMQIAGGQTRVTAGVTAPVAVATGYGIRRTPIEGVLSGAAPGQDIVLSKWIGLEGTAILADRYREKLLARYPAYLVEEAAAFDRFYSVLPEAAIAVKSGVCAMHDASEGGIFAALWELAESAGVGLTIDLKKLPIRQETVEVCECCNVNPYELLAGGCLVMTSRDGEALAAALQAENIPAAVVGRLTESKGRIIMNDGEVRYMDRPKQRKEIV